VLNMVADGGGGGGGDDEPDDRLPSESDSDEDNTKDEDGPIDENYMHPPSMVTDMPVQPESHFTLFLNHNDPIQNTDPLFRYSGQGFF
jgi:hypothetical protein